MLLEYFGIGIEEAENGDFILRKIPLLLKNYSPPLSKLPIFLYKLGCKINWEDEKACLKGILQQLALFNIPESFEQSDNFDDDDPKKKYLIAKYQHLSESLENVLIPALKRTFLPPKTLDKDLVEIANLPGLYKVFERC
jgi:DNA mismatch repair protein MLH1